MNTEPVKQTSPRTFRSDALSRAHGEALPRVATGVRASDKEPPRQREAVARALPHARDSVARDRGFSLAEVLVALVVVSSVLLATMTVLTQHRNAVDRLEARREAWLLAETTLESLRARAIPAVSGPVVLDPTGMLAGRDPSISLVVEPGAVKDLHQITVTIQYRAAGRGERVELTSHGYWPTS